IERRQEASSLPQKEGGAREFCPLCPTHCRTIPRLHLRPALVLESCAPDTRAGVEIFPRPSPARERNKRERDQRGHARSAFVRSRQSREWNKGPGPPDLATEKNHGICAADVAAITGQDAHLFQRRARLEIEPLHYPVCLQREKKETAAAKYSIESSGGGGAGGAIAIV